MRLEAAAQAEQLQPVLLKNIDERGKAPSAVTGSVVTRARLLTPAIGLNVPDQTRLLFVETPANHPFAVTGNDDTGTAGGAGSPTSKKAIATAVPTEGGLPTIRRRCTRAISTTPDRWRTPSTPAFRQKRAVHCRAWIGRKAGPFRDYRHANRQEGVTSARTFVRLRRCWLVDAFSHCIRDDSWRDEQLWLTKTAKAAALCDRRPPPA